MAVATADQAMIRFGRRLSTNSSNVSGKLASAVVMSGYRYPIAGATMCHDPFGRDPLTPDDSGTRLPHFWLDHCGRRLSSLDLVGSGFVVLGGVDVGWDRAVAEAARRSRVPMFYIPVGGRQYRAVDPEWNTACGIQPDGAVLVRPDGFVAWRSQRTAAEPAAALEHAVMRAISGQPVRPAG